MTGGQARVTNLDVKEHVYYETQRDIAETKIHHLLSENLFMPRNKVTVDTGCHD